MWTGPDFSGSKIALVCDQMLVTYLRDDKPGIPFPGQWDLPGGGREGGEDPIACALREVREEFGLIIAPDRVERLTCYPSSVSGGLDTYFCLARLTQADIDAIRFGDEGQRWQLMTIDAYLAHPGAIAHLQARLRHCLHMS